LPNEIIKTFHRHMSRLSVHFLLRQSTLFPVGTNSLRSPTVPSSPPRSTGPLPRRVSSTTADTSAHRSHITRRLPAHRHLCWRCDRRPARFLHHMRHHRRRRRRRRQRKKLYAAAWNVGFWRISTTSLQCRHHHLRHRRPSNCSMCGIDWNRNHDDVTRNADGSCGSGTHQSTSRQCPYATLHWQVYSTRLEALCIIIIYTSAWSIYADIDQQAAAGVLHRRVYTLEFHRCDM